MAVYTKTLNNSYRLELVVVTLSQSISGNSSVIEVTLQLIQGGSLQANSSFNNPYSTSINGSGRSGTKQYNFYNYDALVLDKFTQTIGHNSNGTKSISVSGSFTDVYSQNYVGDGTASGTYTLATIPRASTATVTSPVNAGSTMTINTNRASTSFTHKVEYTFGSASGVIAASGVGASTTWVPPLSLLSQIPNAASGTGNIKVTTYDGGTQIGSPTYTSFTLNAPSSVVPSVGSIAHSEATAGVAANVGAYVQAVTKLAVTVSGSAGIYGSTITSTKVEVGGQTINAASGTTPGTINASGTVPLKVTVTDSRGRTAVSTVNITVLAYAAPKINSVSVQRSNSAGTPDESGTYLRVNINASVSSLVNSTQRNQLRRLIDVAVHGGSYVAKSNVLQAVGTLTFNSFVTVGTYLPSLAYDVKVRIQDDFLTSESIINVPTATIAMHWNGNIGVGIGKYHENGMLDVAGDIFSNNRNLSSGNALGTEDLDTILDGDWVQNLTANATLARHYPTTVAGKLKAVTQGNMTFHGYHLYNNTGYYIRSRYGGVWNPWRELSIRENPGVPYTMAADSTNANSVGAINAGGAAYFTISLPAGRFTQAPIITANSLVTYLYVTVDSITTTSFRVRIHNTNPGAITPTYILWHAVQMNVGSAAG